MHHNRISQHLNAATPSVVMLPVAGQQAAWQNQVYHLAYEKAVANSAPPRRDPFTFSLN